MFHRANHLALSSTAHNSCALRGTAKRTSLSNQRLALLALATVAGCSTWSTTTIPELPIPRMPHNSVVVEAAFVRVPPKQPIEELWTKTDEQYFDSDTRRNLTANGIRCGVVGMQLPDELRDLMSSARNDQPLADGESLSTDSVTAVYRKLQNRSGERSDLIVVPEIAERKVILFSEEGRIRAETFNEGQGLFAVRSYPQGDGTVRVELVPEIKHGEVKHQWVPGNGTLRHDVGRQTSAFDQLRLSAILSPGQTLLVTGTNEPKGLGALLFARGSGDDAERLILLLRLAQTQYDDLFAPEQAAEPLATPLD